jgi:hypothetical protein
VHVPRATCSSTYTIGQPLLGAADMPRMLDDKTTEADRNNREPELAAAKQLLVRVVGC